MMYIIGACNYIKLVHQQDINFLYGKIQNVQPSTSLAFEYLAQNIMAENNLSMPNNCHEAIALYITLINDIEL